jgi:hypothetical protein
MNGDAFAQHLLDDPGFRSNYTMKMFWRSSMPVERVRTLFSWKP